MVLKEKIQHDVTVALKKGDSERAEALRMALNSLTLKEKEKRYHLVQEKPDLREDELAKSSQLNDDEVVSLILSEIKKRKDAIILYEKGNRPELVEKEQREVAILQPYLPEQLSKKEVEALVADSIKRVGAHNIKEMGKVMADVMPKLKGRADSGEVSGIVREILNREKR